MKNLRDYVSTRIFISESYISNDLNYQSVSLFTIRVNSVGFHTGGGDNNKVIINKDIEL